LTRPAIVTAPCSGGAVPAEKAIVSLELGPANARLTD
jgi:hypothetical protein